MWRPGFAYDEAVPATLDGFRRSFCIYSTHHRGSPQRPGLVLGLDRGGSCAGIAYRVRPEMARATLDYLRAREQINGVYREAHVQLRLTGTQSGLDASVPASREVRAVAFIVERAHPSYAGDLPLATQAALMRGAEGISGQNVDYLVNTLAHLHALALREPRLERLLVVIGGYFKHRPIDETTTAKPRCATLLAACRSKPVAAPRLRKGERRRFVHRLQIDVQARHRG